MFETKKSLLFATLLALTLHGSIAHCQQLTIQTEGGKRIALSRTEIEALPHMNIVTKASGADNPMLCGIELDTPRNIWGVSIMPDNWSDTSLSEIAP